MRLLSLVLAVLVAGCADTMPPDDLAEADPSFKTQQAALTAVRRCWTAYSATDWSDACPYNHHIASVDGDVTCPSGRAYICEPNTATFNACQVSCPGGWHLDGRDSPDTCASGGGISTNRIHCSQDNWPSSFTKCGVYYCPEGWHAEKYGYQESCETSTSSNNTSPNSTFCAPNLATAFSACIDKDRYSGKTLDFCPRSYEKITEYYDLNCRPFGSWSQQENNRFSCARSPGAVVPSWELDLEGTVRGGLALTGDLLLYGLDWTEGAVVELTSSDSRLVQVPSTVTVAPREWDVTFPIQTLPVAKQEKVTLTATVVGSKTGQTLTLTLDPPPPVSNVLVYGVPPQANMGSTRGEVSLTDVASSGGGPVLLSSSNPDVAWVPSTVVVPAGSTWTWFTVTLFPVTVDTPVTISATAAGVTRTATLLVPAPPAVPPGPPGQAFLEDEGCDTYELPANDNGSTGSVPLGFPLTVYGKTYSHAFVNNNGNVTFDGPNASTFAKEFISEGGTPLGSRTTIAPFYADVDTRGTGSNVVRYGNVTFAGRAAFCVNWREVGYFNHQADKLNTFQLLLVERGDVGAGDFDIYLNYKSIQWNCNNDPNSAPGASPCNTWGPVKAMAGYWLMSPDGYPMEVEFLPGTFTYGALVDGSWIALVEGAHNSLLPGRYVFEVRNGVGPEGGKLSGRVTNSSSSPLGRAPVQVCPTEGELCKVTYTDATHGTYSVAGLPEGFYTVTVFPPFGSSLMRRTEGPVHVANEETSTVDVTLLPATLMPAKASLTPSTTGDNGVPIVDYHKKLDLSVPGCRGGTTATYSVESDGTVFASGTMREAPAGTYSARVLPLSPNFGPAKVSVNITCPSSEPQTVAFDIYIDPSGAVRTLKGRPVPDALVTLYRSDEPEGPFTVVPGGSTIMSPLNRTNPDVTDSQGGFRWDVIAGYYKVRAERAGCLSPSGEAYTESPVLPVPPPVTDLDLRLDCPELDDLTPPSTLERVSPPANAHGWNTTEVRVEFLATDDDSGVNALFYTLWGAESGGGIADGPYAETLLTADGVTTVSWFALDAEGNLEPSRSLEFRIDKTAPSSSASLSSNANDNGWHTTPVTIELGATDGTSGVADIVYTLSGAQSGEATVSDDSTSVTISAGGTTTLTWYARDVAGNQEAPHTLHIRIDRTAPTLSCEASPAVLFPPNHKLIPVQVNVRIEDAETGSSGSVSLLSVMSDEPDQGLGGGDVPGDIQGWELGTADTSGVLRAERSGKGSGRTYTLTYQGSDLAGNLATCVATVSVPHDSRPGSW